MRTAFLLRHVILASLVGWVGSLPAQWVAFNDHAPGLGTASNVTAFGLADASGQLKDIATGQPIGVTVTITSYGIAGGTVQGRADFGTPAHIVFDGYVDLGGRPEPGIEMTNSSGSFTIAFSGLDPNAEYNFQGTAVRGNINYKARWSIFEIAGARAFTNHHTAGAVTRAEVPSLTSGQVTINTGDNRSGDLAWWEQIRPSVSGTFSVISKQYTGPVPAGVSSGSKGYGITGFRLEKNPTYTGRTNVSPRAPNLATTDIKGIKTVFMVLMENHDWDTIFGSSFCPYINKTLLPRSSYARQYYSSLGVHPSQPNYLWLMAGTNFGIRDDQPPSVNHQSSTNTLFNLLDQAGISWRCYAEAISGLLCSDADSGEFAVDHVPFVFFDSVRNNAHYCTNHIRPYTELSHDLTKDAVARFNFLVPNLTNDMHDLASSGLSTRKQGDDWLAREMPKILASRAYTNDGALFVLWDEGSGDTDGPVGMIALSNRAKGGGYANDLFYTHSSMLRTLQDIFGVKPYLGDAACANDLSDLFKTDR